MKRESKGEEGGLVWIRAWKMRSTAYFHAKADEILAALEFPSPSPLSEKIVATLSFFLSFLPFPLFSFPSSFIAFYRFSPFIPPLRRKRGFDAWRSRSVSSPRHSTKRDARCSTGKVATLLRHARFHSRGSEDTEESREWRFSSENIPSFARKCAWVDQADDGQNFIHTAA